jgi:hypothetical protein
MIVTGTSGTDEGMKMAAVTNPILVLPAVAGLLALTQTAGDAAFNLETHFSSDARGIIAMPSTAEVSRAPDGSPILLRIGSPPDDQDTREAAPLSCAQMQAIDEMELIGEPVPDADCD